MEFQEVTSWGLPQAVSAGHSLHLCLRIGHMVQNNKHSMIPKIEARLATVQLARAVNGQGAMTLAAVCVRVLLHGKLLTPSL